MSFQNRDFLINIQLLHLTLLHEMFPIFSNKVCNKVIVI